ncbi:extracellular solute-binding protein [Thermus thermamylovorans]|uniref:Carbohydrate ABC transporter substrate-binding protein n=1 Tax=Thermus thermamylovorans TaxID=2509362 RepID=A0A4Q9B027_9DEIN|nr:ABC transporter substrate-binding protein [Thermus thermamylovorans]TBH17508.1 carbohydrate ABC transporter substrate-binding protein [Thermus thermamylovorans]
MRRLACFLVAALGLGFAQTLTVVGPWSGSEAEEFLPVLRAFQQQTGIRVEYQVRRAEDLAQILPAQFAARRTVGDVIFMWSWWIGQNARHAEDLRVQAQGVPFLLDTVRDGERVVGLPYVMFAKPGFWYRRSFFQRHGLSEPRSWEEFVALLDRIRALPGVRAPIASGNGVGWPLSDVVEHFLATYGGPEMNLALMGGRLRWQDPRVRQVFAQRLIPLLERRHFSDPIEWTQALQLWWRGDYGLFFMGNWITGMVEDPADLGVFPLPGARAVVGGADYLFVPSYSPNAEAAKRLVAFLVSREGVELRVRQGGKLSMRADVGPASYPPAEQALARALAGLRIIPDLDDTVGGAWQQAFWDQLKLLWVRPGALDDVLRTLDDRMPRR